MVSPIESNVYLGTKELEQGAHQLGGRAATGVLVAALHILANIIRTVVLLRRRGKAGGMGTSNTVHLQENVERTRIVNESARKAFLLNTFAPIEHNIYKK